MTSVVSTPIHMLAVGKGGWSFPLVFEDAAGNPINLGTAGLTPVAAFFQGNIGATTALAVDLVDGPNGLATAIVPEAVVLSTLYPSPSSRLLGGLLSVQASPNFRLYAYLLDALGSRTAEQIIAVLPVDWRSADPGILPQPPLTPITVGPSGPKGDQGIQGVQGIPGGIIPHSAQAGQAVALWQVVRSSANGPEPASSADATQAGTVVGIATVPASAGQTLTYQDGGTIADESWGWVPGLVFFDNFGHLIQSPPSGGFVQSVGRALDAHTVAVGLGQTTVVNPTAVGSGTYADLDFSASPLGGGAVKTGVASYGGAAKGKLAIFTRADGYLDPSLHPPLGLKTSLLSAGTHLLGLPNANFEDGLAGWTSAVTGTGTAAIDATAGNQVTGKQSVKLVTMASGDRAQVSSALFPAGAGIPLSVYARAKSGSGAGRFVLYIGWFDRTGAALTSTPNTVLYVATIGTAFTEVGSSVVPPTGAAYGQAFAYLDTAADTVWIDEVRCVREVAYDVDLRQFGAIGNNATDDTAALQAAMAFLARAGGGTLCVRANHYLNPSVATTITIPANVELRFGPLGLFKIGAKATLTVVGRINAGAWQIFDVSAGGTVTTTSAHGSVAILPEWWGADLTGGADSTAALQSALNFAGSAACLHVVLTGKYLISSVLTVPAYVRVSGQSRFQTLLIQSNAAAGLIVFSGPNCVLERLCFTYSVTPNTGVNPSVIIISQNNTHLYDVFINSGAVGITVNNKCAATFMSNIDIYNTSSSALVLQSCNDVYLEHFIFNCNPGSSNASGGVLRVYEWVEAFVAVDGDVLGGQYSLVIDSDINTAGSRPAYNRFTNVYFDSSIYGSLINNSVETTFTGCWWSGGRYSNTDAPSGSPGLTINMADSFVFQGCEFFNSGLHGCYLGSSSKRTVFNGCKFESNSVIAGPGNAQGIYVGANTTDFAITNCIAHSGLYPGVQGFGIAVQTGSSDRYIITGNLVSGNSVAPISDGGTGTNKQVSANF